MTTHETIGNTTIYNGSALDLYDQWKAPTAIISDGPYGVKGYPGDPSTVESLPAWYEPHVKAWADASTAQTTLWFWGTELSWATVHPVMVKHGWVYNGLHVWDKGMAHVAGNVNSKTIRSFPVVSEVCVRYTREPVFASDNNALSLSPAEWLKSEWKRTGMPLRLANTACGVKNAVTRKYFSKDQYYFPPADMMEKLFNYANTHGTPTTEPYFSVDGKQVTKDSWEHLRAKWNHQHGWTNIWNHPAVRGKERVKDDNGKVIHTNQKPLELIQLIIKVSTDINDVVWDPFAGLATTGVAANMLGRECLTSEITESTYLSAVKRLEDEVGLFTM